MTKDITIESLVELIKSNKIETQDALRVLLYNYADSEINSFLSTYFKTTIDELRRIEDKPEIVNAIIIAYIKKDYPAISNLSITIREMKENKRFYGGSSKKYKRKSKSKSKRK